MRVEAIAGRLEAIASMWQYVVLVVEFGLRPWNCEANEFNRLVALATRRR